MNYSLDEIRDDFGVFHWRSFFYSFVCYSLSSIFNVCFQMSDEKSPTLMVSVVGCLMVSQGKGLLQSEFLNSCDANVVEPITNLPVGDGSYHPVIMILGMVHSWAY